MFKPKQLGFTLVEVMIVVSILVILAAAAMPSYREWIENSKIRSGATSILNGIQKARTSAVLNNTQVRFTLGANTAWTVTCVTAAMCPGGVATIEQRASGDGSSTSVTTTPLPAAATTVTFNNLGVANAGGLTRVTVDNSTTYSGKRPLRIEIGASGAARLCDPAFTLPDPKGC
jgi:type IV fimbrial biogenesis protein FimT